MGKVRSGGGMWERLGVGWNVGEVRSRGGMWERLGVGGAFGRD